jgi:hypothetical protein
MWGKVSFKTKKRGTNERIDLRDPVHSHIERSECRELKEKRGNLHKTITLQYDRSF